MQGVLPSVIVALLAIAAVSDATRHRIPNALSIGVASCALAARAAAGGVSGAASGVVALVLVGALLFPAWSRRAIGGGDLKLAAAAAAWVGLGRVPLYLLASAVAAGALAVVCYAASASAARREIRANLALAGRGVRVDVAARGGAGRVALPAGAAFAAGGLAAAFLGG